jgi:hypothetical protein
MTTTLPRAPAISVCCTFVGECTGEVGVFVCLVPWWAALRVDMSRVCVLSPAWLRADRINGSESPKGQHSPIHKALCPLISPARIQYHCSFWNRVVADAERSISCSSEIQGASKRALQLYSKCYCVASVQLLERWIVCTPLRVNVFVALATQ